MGEDTPNRGMASWDLNQGLSLFTKPMYRRILWSLEAARFRFRFFPIALKSPGAVEMHLKLQSDTIITSELAAWDFTRFFDKTSVCLVNGGPGSRRVCSPLNSYKILSFALRSETSHNKIMKPMPINITLKHRSWSHQYSNEVNSLWSSDALWNDWFWSSLVQVMACYLNGTKLLPGPRLNIKTVLSTYGDFHVKDKTAVRTSYL